MSSEKDLFEVSGPTHLTYVNWNCVHHRRSVAASLVQGVYVLERDRQWNRQGPEARAPAWWKNFHFEPTQVLVDTADSSFFGAVYAFRPPEYFVDPTAANAPNYVIAFRGTITKKGSASRDLELDLQIIRNGLEHDPRFRIAMQTIKNVTSAAGHHRIWLAGHSLGSAIATVAAKNMAREGINLTSFLFNAPFLSAPLEKIKDKRVKQGIRIANSFITAGVATVLKGNNRSNAVDSFAMLSSWVPNLFVNPADPISSEYVGYFDHRKTMEDIGAGSIGRLATQNSVKDLLLGIGRDCEPLHLFPSAILTINCSPSPDFKTAHGIHQWWRPDLILESKSYSYT